MAKHVTTLQKAIGTAGIAVGLGLTFAIGRASTSEESRDRYLRRSFRNAASPYELVGSFVEYIVAEAPKNLKTFQNRHRESPESALADVIVFGVLQQLRLRPLIADQVSAVVTFSAPPGRSGSQIRVRGRWSSRRQRSSLPPWRAEVDGPTKRHADPCRVSPSA